MITARQLFLILSLSASLAAAPLKNMDLSHYLIEHWNDRNGLPQNTVNAIIQTQDGYIWMATQEGLVRFDGQEFKIFNRWNTPQIPHQEIRNLLEGPDGTLWIGTFAGLCSLRKGKFTLHEIEGEKDLNSCNSLHIDPDGTLYMGSLTGVVFRTQTGRYIRMNGLDKGLSQGVNDLIRDRKGRLLAGTDRGLFILDGQEQAKPFLAELLSEQAVNDLLLGSDGTLWIGTRNGLFCSKNDTVSRLKDPEALSFLSINSLFEDRSQRIWIGTQSDGIICLSKGKMSTLTTATGLASKDITSFHEDREGNIWVGSFSNGVHRLWQGTFRTQNHQKHLSGYMRIILQRRDGSIWLAGEDGVVRLDDQLGDTSLNSRLPNPMVRAMYEDSQNRLWIGTRQGVLFVNKDQISWVDARHGLTDPYIRAICEDSDGNILLGSSGQGVFRWQNGRIEHLHSLGIKNDLIRCMFRDSRGRIWIGGNTGLQLLDHGQVRLYTPQDGLPPEPVYSIHEDDENTLWFGTYGGGLLRYREGQFRLITVQQGLFDNTVYRILEDDDQRLWMSCNRGIFQVKRADLNDLADQKISRIPCEVFGVSDGMISSECNGNSQPSGIRTQAGELWFPTSNGTVIVDPRTIRRNPLVPLVTISEAIIDEQSLDTYSREPVELPHGKGQLSFRYAGLSFMAPSKVQFRYRLEGFDNKWVEAGGRREAFYTNIPSGHYTFRVLASNNDGLWNEQGASIRFFLPPYFHQTFWFYGLLVLTTLITLWGLYRWRILRLQMREKELKKKVDKALAEIKILSGLIPICAHCKKIRDDHGFWNSLEAYIKTHSEATFSHGICPDCVELHYKELLSPISPQQTQPTFTVKRNNSSNLD